MALVPAAHAAGQAAAEYVTITGGGILNDVRRFFDRAIAFGSDNLGLVLAVIAGLFVLRLVMKPRTR